MSVPKKTTTVLAKTNKEINSKEIQIVKQNTNEQVNSMHSLESRSLFPLFRSSNAIG